jgi:hypothetical protein
MSTLRRIVILTAAAVTLSSTPNAQQVVGQPLSAWSPGTLEIHQISTGLGNAALHIFPDGTSLLVDAGDLNLDRGAFVPRPNGSRAPGEWIARYARRMLAHDGAPAIDYALMTHLHRDHIGVPGPRSKTGRGGYPLAGISEVAEHVTVRRLLDRAWPDYDHPAAVPNIEHYRAFSAWSRHHAGLTVERIRAGRVDQIRLLRDPARYSRFEVRSIAVNGEVRTGIGSTTRQMFPPVSELAPEDYPTENSLSAVIRVSYGSFDYLTGGDLPGFPDPPGGPPWTDMETAIAPVVGPIDALVLNHHGMFDASNPYFLKTLSPRVVVVPTYAPSQPDFGAVARLLSPRLLTGPKDIFVTGLLDATRGVLGERAAQFKSSQGHVVIRIDSGGESYQVFVLDDGAESFIVKSAHGPYRSR